MIVLRVLALLAVLVALAHALARAGVALNAAALRDAVGALLRHIEQAIEQGR